VIPRDFLDDEIHFLTKGVSFYFHHPLTPAHVRIFLRILRPASWRQTNDVSSASHDSVLTAARSYDVIYLLVMLLVISSALILRIDRVFNYNVELAL
jgi:hypothetical protein